MSEVLLHYIRGGKVECIHCGDIVAVDRTGQVQYQVGDAGRRMFWRSAAKPFQVLPLVERGGLDKFNLTTRELAIMTASHSGEPDHVEIISQLLGKIGLTTEALACGTARPLSGKAARELMCRNLPYQAVHNPCSGKHSGMLALAALLEVPRDRYFALEHPVQQLMLQAVSRSAGLPAAEVETGIDGCGVPVFYLPLRNMALAYAKLANPTAADWSGSQAAVVAIRDAMLAYPQVVAGTGRLDTVIMQVTKGRLVAKVGAEAVYCLSAVNEGLGIALKIDDGGNAPVAPVVISLLKKLDLISAQEFELLAAKFPFTQKNHCGDIIGTVEAVF